MFSEIMLVGTLDGIDPTTKCHWDKSCQLFFNFRCIGFCSAEFELFSESEKVVFCIFVAAKKVPCTEFCSCAPYALRFVPTKSLCTTPPAYLNPDLSAIFSSEVTFAVSSFLRSRDTLMGLMALTVNVLALG